MLSWRYDAEMAPQTRYTLRHNTASIMKGLFFRNPKIGTGFLGSKFVKGQFNYPYFILHSFITVFLTL